MLDCVVACLAIVLLLPVFVLAVLAVRLADGPGVLFYQDRLGIHGTTIRVTKLRSMRTPRSAHGGPTDDDRESHVTRTGRFIRRFKIDEVPQLLGVLRGDLSLVGPRATLVRYLAGYDEFERRRLEVRPGLTGWAQVNGNTSLSHEDRNRLDVWYVDNRSLRVDTRILARTIPSILAGERPNAAALDTAHQHETLARRRG
ncbi:MAG TPA: sugar transferase [Acidimicrobiales bacterium]|nr:sugar transferase [Acidimicrobiales bacterium]